ncbi:hypothetical protein [Pandoraea pnomenusa]|uniref:hypothetical protein n=1 Tax=Pandoraea pnomenusa TaxID=93220 RepID=UPI00333EBDD6
MSTSERKSIRERSPSPRDDEFMSMADVAKVLFVSRPHIAKLIDQGKLKLHHVTGNNSFVSRDSVLTYQAEQQAAIEAYQAAAADEE